MDMREFLLTSVKANDALYATVAAIQDRLRHSDDDKVTVRFILAVSFQHKAGVQPRLDTVDMHEACDVDFWYTSDKRSEYYISRRVAVQLATCCDLIVDVVMTKSPTLSLSQVTESNE